MDAPLCTAKPASTGKYSNIKVKLGERKLKTMDIMAIVKEGTPGRTTWRKELTRKSLLPQPVDLKTKTCFYPPIITDHLLRAQHWMAVVVDSK